MYSRQNMGVHGHLNDSTKWVQVCDSLYGNYLAAWQYLEGASGEEEKISLPTITLYKLQTINKTPRKPVSVSLGRAARRQRRLHEVSNPHQRRHIPAVCQDEATRLPDNDRQVQRSP